VLDLALAGFMAGFLAIGFRRPFIWVLAYLYVDIVAPQKISYFLLASIPISLIVFVSAFGAWAIADDKKNSRFTLRQALLLILLAYCGYTTLGADFPVEAAEKFSWVWKAVVFAVFLPLTLRTRLRFEAATIIMVLSAASIIISGSIKTLATGGGYGELKLLVNDNTGLYESSIISCVSIAIIPLIIWARKHGTIFPEDWRSKLFAAALIFACLLIPIGTQARTGLICIGVLAVISLRTVKRRFLFISLAALAAVSAIPFLPDSYTKRMSTIENHETDESASGRIAIWKWTWDYAKDHPLGGGFDAYRGNSIRYDTVAKNSAGNSTEVDATTITDKSRAYHSSYFEMLGEQGWPGLLLWLTIQLLGLWHMERLRSRWMKRSGPGEQWQAPLANALQQAQAIYLVGSLFVGIAYQPFILMLIGIQCGLWSYLRRIESERAANERLVRRPGAVPIARLAPQPTAPNPTA
jgi:probable O-glycosylation ligase (exosortase A-associated)